MRQKKVVVVGISGPSSSGKSVDRIFVQADRQTLSRLLRSIIPESFILHQDDFYKPDPEIPLDEETGYANWDCHDSLNMDEFINALQHIRNNDGQLPPTFNSIQDKNELGKSGVPEEVVQIMRNEAAEQSLMRDGTDTILCLVDGFLLYSDPGVIKELDIRLLVRAPYEKLKARREARSGYVTIEGFWEDPPQYFDKIVWKSYVKDHSHLFENGDVSGTLKEPNDLNLQTHVQLDLTMQERLMWAMGLISNYLQSIE